MLFSIFIFFFLVSLALVILGLVIKNFPITVIFAMLLVVLSIYLISENVDFKTGETEAITEVLEGNTTNINQTTTYTYSTLFASNIVVKTSAIVVLFFAIYALFAAILGFFGGKT